mgnify:CR=1 FL=1
MRVLVVSSGSTYSTTDVYDGLVSGLRQLGHEVVSYDTTYHVWVEDKKFRYMLAEAGMKGSAPPRRGRFPDKPEYHQYSEELRFNALKDVLVEARRQVVDLVILVSAYLFSDEMLSMLSLRHDTPHGIGVAPTAIVFTESPYEDPRQIRQAALVDAVFVNDRVNLDAYQAVTKAWHLPMGFSPATHFPPARRPEVVHDVVFVGVGYPERVALLEGADWSGINLGLYGDWRFVGKRSPLRPFIHNGIIENARATALYVGSRVGLNMFRSCVDYWGRGKAQARGDDLNPRSYELAACRVPQVTEARLGWYDVFGACKYDATFTCSAEMERKIRQLLEDDDLRERVADEQLRAVQGHSYVDRAARIVSCLTGEG